MISIRYCQLSSISILHHVMDIPKSMPTPGTCQEKNAAMGLAARKQEFWSKYRTCIWIQMPIISAYCIILNMIILDKQRYQLSVFNLFWVRCKKNHDKIQLNYFVFQTGTVKMEWLGIQRFQIYSEQRWTGWIHRRQVI